MEQKESRMQVQSLNRSTFNGPIYQYKPQNSVKSEPCLLQFPLTKVEDLWEGNKFVFKSVRLLQFML